MYAEKIPLLEQVQKIPLKPVSVGFECQVKVDFDHDRPPTQRCLVANFMTIRLRSIFLGLMRNSHQDLLLKTHSDRY